MRLRVIAQTRGLPVNQGWFITMQGKQPLPDSWIMEIDKWLNTLVLSLNSPPEPKGSSQSIENQMPKAAWRAEAICMYLGTSRELKRSCARGSQRPGRRFQSVVIPPGGVLQVYRVELQDHCRLMMAVEGAWKS